MSQLILIAGATAVFVAAIYLVVLLPTWWTKRVDRRARAHKRANRRLIARNTALRKTLADVHETLRVLRPVGADDRMLVDVCVDKINEALIDIDGDDDIAT